MLEKSIGYFQKVVEEGSFSAAARALYLSQPALSKAVAQLEEQLGFPLFDRSGYRPVLTPEGERYYEAVSQMEADYANMVKELRASRTTSVRIGFPSAQENQEFMKAVQAAIEELPGIDFTFHRCGFNDALPLLRRDAIDLCLGVESTFRSAEDIAYEVLRDYEMCVICSFDHPLANRPFVEISDLVGQDMILLSKKFGQNLYKDYMEDCRLDHFHPKIRKQVDTFDELLFEVTIGSGIAIVSEDVVPEHQLRAVPLKNSHFRNRNVLAYRKEQDKTRLRPILQKIQDHFPAL